MSNCAAQVIGAFTSVILDGIPDADVTVRAREVSLVFGVAVTRDGKRWFYNTTITFLDVVADPDGADACRAAKGIVRKHNERWTR